MPRRCCPPQPPTLLESAIKRTRSKRSRTSSLVSLHGCTCDGLVVADVGTRTKANARKPVEKASGPRPWCKQGMQGCVDWRLVVGARGLHGRYATALASLLTAAWEGWRNAHRKTQPCWHPGSPDLEHKRKGSKDGGRAKGGFSVPFGPPNSLRADMTSSGLRSRVKASNSRCKHEYDGPTAMRGADASFESSLWTLTHLQLGQMLLTCETKVL